MAEGQAGIGTRSGTACGSIMTRTVPPRSPALAPTRHCDQGSQVTVFSVSTRWVAAHRINTAERCCCGGGEMGRPC